jgi:Domain of unknown function (DUF1707)
MSQAQATSGEPAVRASDAERDQATEILRVAYAEGRLTRAELDQRTGAAYAAKTRADLSGLTSGAVSGPGQAAAWRRCSPTPGSATAGRGTCR